jgi:hypothetical protein
MFSVAVAYAGILHWDVARNIDSMRESLETIRGSGSVEAISEEEFYSRFSLSVQSASHCVDICYLDVRAPDSPRGSAKAKYYKDLPRLIKSHGNVQFRRLSLLSEHTATWILEIAEEMRGAKNFSMRLFDGNMAFLEHAISVQCVDDNEAYLVAPGEQRPKGRYRDLHLHSEGGTGLLKRYYEKLWAGGKPLIESGDVRDGLLIEIRDNVARNSGRRPLRAENPPS